MAEISREQLNQVVARVVGEVASEVKANEGAFGVSDLRSHLTDLAGVGEGSAWTISYSTAAASIEQLRDVARVGGESAWTISYSTAAASPIVEKVSAKGQGR